MQWRTDILGDDFQACAFEAAGPDGVLRTATLVRHTPLGSVAGRAGGRSRAGSGCRNPGARSAAGPGRALPARLE